MLGFSAVKVRCSTLQTCMGAASILVVINDTPTLFFDKAAAAPFQVEENGLGQRRAPGMMAGAQDGQRGMIMP